MVQYSSINSISEDFKEGSWSSFERSCNFSLFWVRTSKAWCREFQRVMQGAGSCLPRIDVTTSADFGRPEAPQYFEHLLMTLEWRRFKAWFALIAFLTSAVAIKLSV